jgi:hypothetical protein
MAKEDMPIGFAEVPMEELLKQPAMKRHKCKNHMLECINTLPNMVHNGHADSQWNDFILFEDMFEHWDGDAILLTKWRYDREYAEPYVYIQPLAVFTNIGDLARRLQHELPHDREISAMMWGDELHLDDGRYTYRAAIIEVNQKVGAKHYEGWKFDIKPAPKEVGKI